MAIGIAPAIDYTDFFLQHRNRGRICRLAQVEANDETT